MIQENLFLRGCSASASQTVKVPQHPSLHKSGGRFLHLPPNGRNKAFIFDHASTGESEMI